MNNPIKKVIGVGLVALLFAALLDLLCTNAAWRNVDLLGHRRHQHAAHALQGRSSCRP